MSTATLWVGYATLAFASFVPIRRFGELSLVARSAARSSGSPFDASAAFPVSGSFRTPAPRGGRV